MHDVNWANLSTIKAAQRAENRTNCPNCGAPIDHEKCDYCGTVFIDVACLDADAPCYLKVKMRNRNGGPDAIVLLKVQLRSAEYSVDTVDLCANNSILYSLPGSRELVLTFNVL